uniref:Reverse transcriptase domain-containing protein n=1 Tax=Oryzias sinensis TaxID=183150 RepID=A0A8C7ZH32_9TELE
MSDNETLIRIMSWNCKGLNGTVKRNKILSHVNTMGADVMFLQETHLKICSQTVLRKSWVGHLFHSKFNLKSRGVAILIRKNIPFICNDSISDPQGRFIIVTGKLCGTPVILANIYAPNHDDEQFFQKIISYIPNIHNNSLLLGGDFNCVLDPLLDRSSNSQQTLTKSAKLIRHFLNSANLVDPWRDHNPSKREYSFFSQRHNSYSRIDMFLVDSKLKPIIKRVQYEAIVLSDHGPVTLLLGFPKFPSPRTWKMNNSFLTNESFKEFIDSQLAFYFETNDSPDISKQCLWEAMKAYMRGQIISHSVFRTKKEKLEKQSLAQQILKLDQQYSCNPNPQTLVERTALQTKFNLLSTNEAVKLIRQTKQNFYEHGEKPSRLLAHQIKVMEERNQIEEIITKSGTKTSDQQAINTEFKMFYKDLYSSEVEDANLVNNFFEDLSIPLISQKNKTELENSVTLEEVKQAIKDLQSSKAPGPDGYTVEFYKSFIDRLAPVLLQVYNESLCLGRLPQTLYQATISVIHKKDKDPTSVSSYRPISLLNVDAKILAKILSNRLESVLPTIIHADQNGFIKNRQLSHNLRRLFNIIFTRGEKPTPELLISLDAEKAFDRVEWSYLFFTLAKFGFGDSFISWVKLLYAFPVASIQTNGYRSEYFPLARSTRQGCPLSPLLFAIAIEPLAISLRTLENYTGILRAKCEHKVSLYADDLLLYISNPSISIPSIMRKLEFFGSVSGYKININKSIIFPINDTRVNISGLPLKISYQFKYLGVTVTSSVKELYNQNFAKLVEQTTIDLERWSFLPLSLAGRVGVIKMTVLPKFLFLFQSIPLHLSKSFFKKLDKIILEFIWNKKVARIRREFLQRPKSSGGMGLPNFQFYYWACNLKNISYWITEKSPNWMEIEQNHCTPSSPKAFVFADITTISLKNIKDLVVSHTVRIWKQIVRHFGLQANPLSGPIVKNHLFSPSMKNDNFADWFHRGLRVFKDLYIDGLFPSFELLKDKYNLPNTHFFKFLQVRDFVRHNSPNYPQLPEESVTDSLFLKDPATRGGISHLYNKLSHLNGHSTLQHLREAWQEELGINISEEQWDLALGSIHTTSICARHGLIQFKIIHRLHWTRLRLSKIFPDVDPLCIRCGQAPASLSHMFWGCSRLSNFWSDISLTLSKILNQTVKLDPLIGILGITDPQTFKKKSERSLIKFTCLVARRIILLNWKQIQPPTHIQWIRDILCFLNLEKIRYTLQGREDQFFNVWSTFIKEFGKNS